MPPRAPRAACAGLCAGVARSFTTSATAAAAISRHEHRVLPSTDCAISRLIAPMPMKPTRPLPFRPICSLSVVVLFNAVSARLCRCPFLQRRHAAGLHRQSKCLRSVASAFSGFPTPPPPRRCTGDRRSDRSSSGKACASSRRRRCERVRRPAIEPKSTVSVSERDASTKAAWSSVVVHAS